MKTSRRLLIGTILGSLHTVVFADTVISTETNTPLNTQSAGDITIEEDGSIEVSSGAPVTIDASASLSIEEGGEIIAGEDSGTSGVLVTTTQPFSILNESLIEVEEDFVPEDEDGNGVPDGQIANASDRAGIRVTSAAQGTIDNEGTITVDGLNSYGIVLEDSFTGDIINDGAINVIGDYSTGIAIQSLDGDVLLEGGVSATGEGAQALVIAGDVSGTLSIQGSVAQQRSFSDDDGGSMTLSRGDLSVRAPAVEINGNVAGGILIAAVPYDLDDDNDDEDNDGVDDDEEGTGALVSYGVSPALYIGGAAPIDIGGVEGRDGTFSLVVDGSITSSAGYSSISNVAVEIGGEQQTTLGQGIGVSGTITATTYDSETIAILLNETAVVPYLYNSGNITASISSSGDGSTIAILDRSGTLTKIDNSGFINAAGSREDVKVALDLSNAASGVTITQYLNDIDADTKADEEDEEDYDPNSPTIYTAIYGDLLLSNYDDVLDVSSGLISGHTYFNNGDDALNLSDDAVYYGDIHKGSGQLTVTLNDRSKYYGTIDPGGQSAILNLLDSARFIGTFENAENLTANVQGGILFAEDGEIASFGTLNVDSGGSIGIIIDGEDGTSSSFDVGTATFATGSKIQADINNVSNAEGSYEILTADQINGAPTLDAESNEIPLIYNAEMDVGPNDIVLTIARKSAQELGLNSAQSQAYDAIWAMLPDQSNLEASILQAESVADIGKQFDGLLPDYAGGVFEFATRASELARTRIQSETRDFSKTSLAGAWVAPYYFQSHFSDGDSDELEISGEGLAGAIDFFTIFGTVGVDLSYTRGKVRNGSRQDLKVNSTEFGGYWRHMLGPVYAYARLSGARVEVSSTRQFEGTVDDTSLDYEADADWDGFKVSALAGASVKISVTDRFKLLPALTLDYERLHENGYGETGDSAIDLTVESRTSDRFTALATLTSSFAFGDPKENFIPVTLDLQAGRKFNLVENLGDTVAAFDDGDPFTITAPSRSSVWQAEAKVHGGGYAGTWSVTAGADKGKDQWSANVRAAITLAF